jgi:putative ABC transport system permease protein
MNLWQLVFREIRFRKISFLLGLVCVMVAIAGLIGSVTLLQAHDVRTEQILTERERSTREQMQQMEDDYRRIMRDMGYNVMIFAQGQSLAALRTQGHPDTVMPYEYVQRLARGHVETVNHLLPVLQKRMEWPEHGMEVILSGTPGQVPVYHKRRFLTEDGTAYRDPIMQPVPPGELILGHSVASDLGLRVGDTITLKGRQFRIRRIDPAEGTTDDIAVWCDLATAQEFLGVGDEINVILALECVCTPDALGIITQEVQRILPGVQVLEFSSRVKARAQARSRAEEAHKTAIEAERDHRRQMYAERRLFASILVPLVLAGSALWIFVLILGNVRERRAEIGILRALGVRESTITAIFLLKAVMIGVVGSLAGYLLGIAVGAAWGGVRLFSGEFVGLISVPVLFASLLIAPALCALAGWLPAVRAAQQDPAAVLRDQ